MNATTRVVQSAAALALAAAVGFGAAPAASPQSAEAHAAVLHTGKSDLFRANAAYSYRLTAAYVRYVATQATQLADRVLQQADTVEAALATNPNATDEARAAALSSVVSARELVSEARAALTGTSTCPADVEHYRSALTETAAKLGAFPAKLAESQAQYDAEQARQAQAAAAQAAQEAAEAQAAAEAAAAAERAAQAAALRAADEAAAQAAAQAAAASAAQVAAPGEAQSALGAVASAATPMNYREETRNYLDTLPNGSSIEIEWGDPAGHLGGVWMPGSSTVILNAVKLDGRMAQTQDVLRHEICHVHENWAIAKYGLTRDSYLSHLNKIFGDNGIERACDAVAYTLGARSLYYQTSFTDAQLAAATSILNIELP